MLEKVYLSGYLSKEAKVLTSAGRAHIKKKNFAFPSKADNPKEKKQSGNYPINDRAHARAALAYGRRFLSPEKFEALKRRVHAKYPTMGKESSEKTAADARKWFSQLWGYLTGNKANAVDTKAAIDRIQQLYGKPVTRNVAEEWRNLKYSSPFLRNRWLMLRGK